MQKVHSEKRIQTWLLKKHLFFKNPGAAEGGRR
jgi:hypothetical protein